MRFLHKQGREVLLEQLVRIDNIFLHWIYWHYLLEQLVKIYIFLHWIYWIYLLEQLVKIYIFCIGFIGFISSSSW